MHTWLKVLLCATLVACVSAGALGDTVTWDGGGLDGRWFTKENWDADTLPVAGDDVVDLTDEDIVYDFSDPDDPIDPFIDTFSACGSFADVLTVQDNSILTILSNMHYDVASTGTYTIHVLAPSGVVNIGDGAHPTATTSNFDWIVEAFSGGLPDAQVNVTGFIGQGDWTVYGGVDAGAIHTLDGWLVDGGRVTVGTLINITDWTVTNSGRVTASVWASVQSAQVSHTGTLEASGSPPARLVVNSTGTVTLSESGTLRADGLFVKGVVTGTTGATAEGVDELNVSGTIDMDCGKVFASDLLVGRRATIILHDSPANNCSGSTLSTDFDHGAAQSIAMNFVGDSTLVFGDAGNKFWIGPMSAPAQFSGSGSRIERLEVGGEPDPTADLFMGLNGSLDIASHVSLEAIRWDTTRVDVESHPIGPNPVELEMIAPDNCNIMFVDGNGDLSPDIPCIKYWRSLRLVRFNLDFVNVRDNHVPYGESPNAALYLIEGYNGPSLPAGRVDLMGSALYYGGDASGEIIDSVTGTPRYSQLILTTYGDFDGDCDVDDDDLAQFNAVKLGSDVVTCYPLADADGDCDVDDDDLAIFNIQYGNDTLCQDPPGTYVNEPRVPLDPACPTPPTDCDCPECF